jgi:hypothetical protein
MKNAVTGYEEFMAQGKLGRHETFTPRYGWLKKGYDAASKRPDIFRASDAIEQLGVGKNMVRSIKFWCQALKVLEDGESGGMAPTELGNSLFRGNEDGGWDPYLEDMASLWLLHWQLFIPPLDAVNWSFAFNRCNLWSFNIRQLTSVIQDYAQKHEGLSSLSEKSFERDASCIIRMYTDVQSATEWEIECPFTQLHIMRPAEEPKSVRFNISPKRNLPALIFAASCFSYMSHYAPGSKTISIHRLTYDVNSPGVAFKLPESVVGAYLYEAEKRLDGFKLVDVVGDMQLHCEKEFTALYKDALREYYMGRSKNESI